MGTVFNAKKWKGACVKGKKVCGLVKNGALFFKSDNYIPPISEIYKRRIMVGDNLKGKKVYADFPNDYILELQDRLGTSFKTNTLVNATNGLITEYTFPSMSGSGTEYYVASNFASDSSDNRFYWCSSSNTDNYVNNSEVLLENDKDYNATQIDDTNPSYRHLFIEDENIRPLKIGDKLINGTKIYCNFPDDFRSIWYPGVLPNMNSNKGYVLTGNRVENGNIHFANVIIRDDDGTHNLFSDTSNTDFNNLSQFTFSLSETWTITSIDNSWIGQSMILVDTTTLGT